MNPPLFIRFRSLLFAALLIAAGASVARADEADAAAAKEAAKAFFTALQKGDAAAVKSLTKAETEDQERAMRLIISMLGSAQKLSALAEEKFGDEAADLAAMQGEIDEMLKNIDQSEVTIENGRATFSEVDEDELVFTKDGASWKFNPGATEGFMPPVEVMDEMEKGLKQMDQVVEDLKAGKFKTAEELTEAVEKIDAL
jgi:hypothetical protein